MKEIAPNVIMIPQKEETAQDQERKRSLRVPPMCLDTKGISACGVAVHQPDNLRNKIL